MLRDGDSSFVSFITSLNRYMYVICIVTQVNSSTEVTKFLLNPTNVSLGEMTVTPEDLQLSGLDNLIRKFLGEKHIKRYQLLRKFGIVNTKRKA